MAKNKNLGYQLHKERILFSGGEIIRSIKYPLKVFRDTPQDTHFFKNLITKIIDDDLKIRGEINLIDYLNSLSNNKKIYTLFDFWLDSLRAGVIFMPKSNNLIDFLYKIYQEKKPAEEIWEKASCELKNFFDKDSFIKKFILPKSIRKGKKTAASLKRDLTNCLLEKYKIIKEKNQVEIKDTKAKELIDFITASFFGENNKLILDTQGQINFWREKFNLNKSLLEESKPHGELGEITCFIIPELIGLEKENNIEDLIRKREQWLSRKSLEDDLKAILGITENFNAYSNYLGKFFRALLVGKVEEIYQVFFSIIPAIEKDKEKILKAIQYLSDKAKKLGEPQLVSTWADYRSVFGGKIQSWYSNFENRDIKIKEQKEKLQQGIERIFNFFSFFKGKNSPSEIQDIEFFLKRLVDFLGKANLNDQENFQLFEDLTSLIKTKINIFYLQNIVDERNIPVNKYEVNGIKIFSPLYERFYRPISFYGHSTFKSNEKFIQRTIPIINNGIDIIFSLLKELIPSFSLTKTFDSEKKKNETSEDSFRNLLEFFWSKYKGKAINTQIMEEKYEGILNSFIKPPKDIKEFLKNGEKYVIYKSEFAKGSQKVIAIKEGNFLELEKNLIKELTFYLLNFKKEDLFKNPLLLVDFLELAKKVTSLLIRFNKELKFGLSLFSFENFDKAKNYIKTFNISKTSKKDLGYIINSLIFSEIKGAATLFSKREYLAKYSAQVINSNEKFNLFLMFRDLKINPLFSASTPTSFERKKYLNSPHLYLLSPFKVEKDKDKKESEFLRLDKDKVDFFPVKDKENQFFLKISSSYYQTQFLDKYLFRPKGWEDINIKLSEWSFIVEKKYQINWDILTERPVLKEETEEGEKLFVSIPFLISSKKPQKTIALKVVSSDRLSFPILGIDVGEYGLGWCLTKINEERIEILANGFIEDRNIAAIKDNFSLIQQKARRGIFNISSDLVSEVRKNAVGGLRNEIHAILTTHKASIIYEFSISNFETGSGRTTRIYNSIKKTDIPSEIDADQKKREHIWGVKYQVPGTHISAYGSSYTCYKCKKSLFEIKKEDLKNIIFKERKGNILVFDSLWGKIHGFSEIKRYKEGDRLEVNEETLKQFKKIIADFARPPLKSEVLLTVKNHKEEELKLLKKTRGNSAVFVCPLCLNETDADIQAALMMAIRGYLKFKKKLPSKTEKEEEKIDWFQENLSFLRKVPIIGEINLVLKRD